MRPRSSQLGERNLSVLVFECVNKIEKIYVKEGQVVQQGDLLVQLSDIEIKTNIANLQARLLFYQQVVYVVQF
jgi:multidrug efflux pump subunit AcrA (membrane-fusion protein)